MRWLRAGSPDPEGLRALLLTHQDEGTVEVYDDLEFDAEGLGVDLAFLCEPGALGTMRMRIPAGAWFDVTDDPLTTFQRPAATHDGLPFPVELEVTVPTGDHVDLMVYPVWQLPGAL